MNGIDLEHALELEWEHRYAMEPGREHHYAMELEWEEIYTEYGRIQRRAHGHHLTELAVIHVCNTIMERELWGISANAFTKRVGRRYHRLRRAKEIPEHTRPRLTTRCMEELIAFIREIPQDIRYVDALEDVLIYCIEYAESKRERRFIYRKPYPGSPEPIPEGW